MAGGGTSGGREAFSDFIKELLEIKHQGEDITQDAMDAITNAIKDGTKDAVKQIRSSADDMEDAFDDVADAVKRGSKKVASSLNFDELKKKEKKLFNELKKIGTDTHYEGKFDLDVGNFDTQELEKRIDLLKELRDIQEDLQSNTSVNLTEDDFLSKKTVDYLSKFIKNSEIELRRLQRSGLKTTQDLFNKRVEFDFGIYDLSEDWDKGMLESAKSTIHEQEIYNHHLENLREFIRQRTDLLSRLDDDDIASIFSEDEIEEYRANLRQQLTILKKDRNQLRRLRSDYEQSLKTTPSVDSSADDNFESSMDKKAKSVEKFMKLWNKLMSESDNQQSFGERNAYLLENVTAGRLSETEAYDELIYQEEKYKESLKEEQRINRQRNEQLQEFIRLSEGMIPEDVTDEISNKNAKIYTDILNKITQEGLSASDAIQQLREQIKGVEPIQEVSGQVSADDLELKTLSSKEISTAFKNIDLGGFLNSLNIAKKHTQELKRLFIDLLNINKNLDAPGAEEKWESKQDEIIQYLTGKGAKTDENAQDTYREFLKFMSTQTIKYTKKDTEEFSGGWSVKRKEFSRYLSQTRGLEVDSLYKILAENFSGLFRPEEELSDKQGQLSRILDVLGEAIEATRPKKLEDSDKAEIEEWVSNTIASMLGNLHATEDAKKSPTKERGDSDVLEETAKKTRDAAQANEELAEASEKAAERTKQEKEDLEETAGAIIRVGEAHDKIKTVYDEDDNLVSKTVTDSRTRANAIETESKYYTYQDGIETLEATTIVEDFKKRAAELKKEQDKIALAQTTLNKFLSQFENKTAGQAGTIKGYNELKGFTIGNLDDIEKATQSMIALDTEYNKITKNFRQGTKSMNPFVNAITGVNEMANEVEKAEIAFKGLTTQPEGLAQEINQLNPLLEKMKSYIVEDADGNKIITDIYGLSEAYGELNTVLRKVNSDISVQKQKDTFDKNKAAAEKKQYEDLARVQKALYDERARLEKAEYGSANAKILERSIEAKQEEYNLLMKSIQGTANYNKLKAQEAQLEQNINDIIKERREREEDEAFAQMRAEEEARIKREEEANYRERAEQIKAEAEAEKELIQMKKDEAAFNKEQEKRAEAERKRIAAESDAGWKQHWAEQEAEAQKQREINLSYEAEAAREATEAEKELAEARKASDEYFKERDAKVAAENAIKQKELNNLYQERQKIISELLSYHKLLADATDDATKDAAQLAIESAKGRLNQITTDIFNYGDLVDEGKLQQQNTMAVEDLRKFNWSKHIKDTANESQEAYDKLLAAQKKYYDLEKQFANEEGEAESKRLLDATIAAEKEYNEAKKNTKLTSEQQLELDRKELQYQEELQRIINQASDKKKEDDKKAKFKNIEDLYDKFLNELKAYSDMDADTSGKDHTVSMDRAWQKAVDACEELRKLGIDVFNIEASTVLTQEQKNKLLEKERKHREYINDLAAKAADTEHTSEKKEQEKINKQNQNYGKSRYNTESRAYNKLMASVRSMEEDTGLSDSFLAKINDYKDAFEKLTALRKQFESNPNLVNTVDADGIAFTDKFQDAALKAESLRKEISNIISTSSKLDDIFKDLIIKKSDGPWDVSKYQNAQEAMKAFADEVSNGTFKFDKFNQTGTEMYGTLINSEGAIEKVTIALRGASGEMVAFKTKTGDVATDLDRFKSDMLGSAKQIAGMYLGFNDIVRYLRQGIEHVREIDAAMTELRKVTDETEASYARFLQTASAVSSSIGSTVTDFTTVASDFARLGYTMNEAADLAKTALIYENVGDGFSSVEEASESIISTMKAFGIEAEDTMGIVDRFNAVGEYCCPNHIVIYD